MRLYFKSNAINLIAFLLLWLGAASGFAQKVNPTDIFDIDKIPPQPGKDQWYFVEDLKSPFWQKITWTTLSPPPSTADLRQGIQLEAMFPDPKNLLNTAYEDFEKFCIASDLEIGWGNFRLKTHQDFTLKGEEFRLEVNEKEARLYAGHVDGIRRGIFFIEDEMLSKKGPFLSLGVTHKKPAIERRISRCFFSPIKRPGNHPGLGDELMDDIDYYPDEYLNRLAHEGVNGLWLTVSSKDGNESSVGFGDLVSTEITPNEGVNGERRLAKLKQIVDKCLRYGIRIYIKTMEPHVRFTKDDPRLKKFPDIAGHYNRGHYYLCASGSAGQQYLYQAVKKIFTAVPELGGMINISHGELYTTCLSALPATRGGKITCPRCSKIPEWKILSNSLSAMKKGMEEVAPNAELISWLYMPQPQSQSFDSPNELADWVYTIPSNTPPGVILQFNFESGVEKEVFGKKLIGGDYWISSPGPSERFVKVAKSAAEKSTPVSAKIQTGTSYEVSTVPYVPVPSLLYQKFNAMKSLGVSHTMLNWIVGASPGLMNKAAGLLSQNEYASEIDFLNHLASIYWKAEDVNHITKAWTLFSKSYQNYPLTNLFQYYGPVNDGIAWPLLLVPQDAILAPTYQLGSRNTLKPWLPSGDRIGECFTELLTLDEVTELCRRMSEIWDEGLEILEKLEEKYIDDKDRFQDIGVAKSLGIQIKSAYNILKFYSLREKMLREEGMGRAQMLTQLTDIILQEIASTQKMIKLCESDSRLGFHADAEGYKFFPEKLKWRIDQLTNVLNVDVPMFKKKIEENQPLFPEYTGLHHSEGSAFSSKKNNVENLNSYSQILKNNSDSSTISWLSHYDANNLYFVFSSSNKEEKQRIESLVIVVEKKRLFPSKIFRFGSSDIRFEEGGASAWVAIPLSDIQRDKEKTPLRINITAHVNGVNYFWRESNPLPPRLMLGSNNPKDLDWLIFE